LNTRGIDEAVTPCGFVLQLELVPLFTSRQARGGGGLSARPPWSVDQHGRIEKPYGLQQA